MLVRSWLNNNAILVTSVAVALLMLAMVIVLPQLDSEQPDVKKVYYWDLELDAPFVHRAERGLQVLSPSGGSSARAHLYSCGECTPDQWVGYLTREGRYAEETGELRVRSLDDERWRRLSKADEVMEPAYTPCPDDPERLPEECLP